MERVDIEEFDREPHPMGVNRQRRDVGAAVGTENITYLGVNAEVCRWTPGLSTSGGGRVIAAPVQRP